MQKQFSYLPGITLRSVGLIVFGLVVVAVLTNFVTIVDSWALNFGANPISVPVVIFILFLLCMAAVVRLAAKYSLISKAELVCIFYALLIASPIMTNGFWRGFLSASTALVKWNSGAKYDLQNSNLWPKGKDLLAGRVHNESPWIEQDSTVTWATKDVLEGRNVLVFQCTNANVDDVSRLRVKIPVRKDSVFFLKPGKPYFLTTLVRAKNLEGNAYYYCRTYADDNSRFDTEAFISRKQQKVRYINQFGFVRNGIYGLTFPENIENYAFVEFGLSGKGSAEFALPEIIDVSYLEAAFSGRKSVSRDVYERLSAVEQLDLLIKPQKRFSWEWWKFKLIAYVPWSVWFKPLGYWVSFAFLLMTAMFAIAAIMRKQWISSERYPLPLGQMVYAIVDGKCSYTADAPSLWRNNLFWGSLVLTTLWCIFWGWGYINPSMPSAEINIPLKSYFSDPGWGKTWNSVAFRIFPLFFAIGLFMETNVSISLVLGYFLYRFQFLFGESTGLTSDKWYPYPNEQILGGMSAYALLTLVFTRRYIWQTIKQAISGTKQSAQGLSHRFSYLLLLCCYGSVLLWSLMTGISATGVIVFFTFMLLIAIAAMKIRAECGTPDSGFASGAQVFSMQAMLPIIGGIMLLGSDAALFVSLAMIILGAAFFNIPGTQLELIEAGFRFNVRRSHIVTICFIGISGGLLIGGWVYLSNIYAHGADNYLRAKGLFGAQNVHFQSFDLEMVKATNAMKEESVSTTLLPPNMFAFAFSALITIVLSLIRQWFAGFWFHPVGFILGPSLMVGARAAGCWASLLAAAAIRFMVLRFGGAATVRNKLLPVALGVFIGAVVGTAIFIVVNGYVYFFNFGANEFRGYF